MIKTEQNHNAEGLGSTRTFSVPTHSADTMKNRINSDNSQLIEARRQAKRLPVQDRHAYVRTSSGGTQNGGSQVRRSVPQNQARNIPESERLNRPKPARQLQSTAQPVTERGQVHTPAKPNSAGKINEAQRQPVRQVRNASVREPAEPVLTEEEIKAEEKKAAREASLEADRQELALLRQKNKQLEKQREIETARNNEEKIKALKAERKKNAAPSEEGGNTVVSAIKAVVYIIFILVVSIFLAITGIKVGNDIFAFVKSDEDIEVTIPEYATLDNVSEILFKNDVIKYPTVFKYYAVMKHDSQEYIAGTYVVNGMMNYDTLLAEFKEKEITGTIRLTIPEGYTTDEIIDLFVSNGIGTREGFEDVIQNGEFDYWFINELPENENRIYRLEGYLFPDTYEFYLSSSETTVINKMLKRFAQIFSKEYRTRCDEMGYSVDQIITLASMIEREAESPSQFYNISSVFHNRLNSGGVFAKLESDATIVYVVSHEKGTHTAITADDLYINTPYNTYMYEGLPPGPIANPSASAMLAALSPVETNFYYFIANAGVTYFSETKEQHDAYIAEFKSSSFVQTTGDVQIEEPKEETENQE